MIRDSVVIVTGAASGMGRDCALEFAKRGANVVISDVRNDPLLETSREIESLGAHYLSMKVDVISNYDVERMVQETLKKFGKIDVLINNAGAYRYGNVVDLNEKDWDFVMDVNVKGIFLCSRAVARQMIKQGRGKIINVSSIAGKTAYAGDSVYCASKFAVIGFTQSLALELARYRINVNAVCPGIIFGTDLQEKPGGFVEADMWKTGITDPEEMKKTKESWVPLGRAGRPEDVTKLVLFLASEDSDYITGQAINVDGGLEKH
jgi:NAD(P)-dependent dehydrogenase (short-subunit alcohol dehydrogenase family)